MNKIKLKERQIEYIDKWHYYNYSSNMEHNNTMHCADIVEW